MDDKPRKSNHVAVMKSDDKSKVFNLKDRTLFNASLAVGDLINECDGSKTPKEISEIIAKKHDIEKQEVIGFIDKLKRKGLVR